MSGAGIGKEKNEEILQTPEVELFLDGELSAASFIAYLETLSQEVKGDIFYVLLPLMAADRFFLLEKDGGSEEILANQFLEAIEINDSQKFKLGMIETFSKNDAKPESQRDEVGALVEEFLDTRGMADEDSTEKTNDVESKLMDQLFVSHLNDAAIERINLLYDEIQEVKKHSFSEVDVNAYFEEHKGEYPEGSDPNTDKALLISIREELNGLKKQTIVALRKQISNVIEKEMTRSNILEQLASYQEEFDWTSYDEMSLTSFIETLEANKTKLESLIKTFSLWDRQGKGNFSGYIVLRSRECRSWLLVTLDDAKEKLASLKKEESN